MSLDQEQIRRHCEIILASRRILNKIVVLCEGDIIALQDKPSPQAYRQMERMPDSNFYKACVPRSWSQFLPQFFNCGDRNDVLNTYFTLLELNALADENSYLDSTKLFAIIDLDIQVGKIKYGYPFVDTEEIFTDLYEKAKVNENNALQHRIWVTGLIHKEAYFLVPDIQAIFDDFASTYQSKTLLLKDIYLDMCAEIIHDADLQGNFQRACDRISYCSGLDFNEIEKLRDSWLTEFQNSQDSVREQELVFILLTIRKAKGYWNQVQPNSEWPSSTAIFRDQLLLEIGRFYSQQTDTERYHIPSFFKILYQSI